MRLGTSARDFITLGEGSEPTPLESPGVVSVGATASLRKITNVCPTGIQHGSFVCGESWLATD